jgi:MraZ protein
MHPAKLDEKGRLKVPSVFLEHFERLGEKRFFVTTVDSRIVRIYPISVWERNEAFFASSKGSSQLKARAAFLADAFGSELELDSQGRMILPAELRNELKLESQQVRLWAYKGHVQILSQKIYQERLEEAKKVTAEDVSGLEDEGME